jgi:hypothetical protein
MPGGLDAIKRQKVHHKVFFQPLQGLFLLMAVDWKKSGSTKNQNE